MIDLNIEAYFNNFLPLDPLPLKTRQKLVDLHLHEEITDFAHQYHVSVAVMDSIYKMFAENNEHAFDLDRDISQHLLIPLIKYYDRYNQLGLNVITVEYSNGKIRIYWL